MTENEVRQACESESLRHGSDESQVPPGEREATNTPTEATRWHTQAAREGHCMERLRKVRMSLEGLKIEDTR